MSPHMSPDAIYPGKYPTTYKTSLNLITWRNLFESSYVSGSSLSREKFFYELHINYTKTINISAGLPYNFSTGSQEVFQYGFSVMKILNRYESSYVFGSFLSGEKFLDELHI